MTRIPRGQAVILLVILIAMGVATALFVMIETDSVSRSQRQTRNNDAVLAEVKMALIGWSAARDPALHGANARPGELPCPDINPRDGYEDGSCVAGAIGRVPWKTLGIPEPKDASGETLWYAVSGPFRIFNMNTSPITSDTAGDLTVYQDNKDGTATVVTSQAIAVLFAPGAALGSQDRSPSTSMACTAPSGTYPRNQCASNYLDSWSGITPPTINNATINGPFISASSAGTFNDRLLFITNADLMPIVEQRVAREMMMLLEQYRLYRVAVNGGGSGDYPSADVLDGHSNDQYNRHRFPCGNAIPSPWLSAGITLPNWLTNGCGSNGWASIIFYAVARNRLVGNNCLTCSWSTASCLGTWTSTTFLTVANPSSLSATSCSGSPFTCAQAVLASANNYALVLITPGARTNSRTPWSSSLSPIAGYFEDAQNSDNDDYNCFVVPSSISNDRDRIYVVQ